MSYNTIKETIRKYYKLWTKPVLTSAGIMGGDSFAVAQSSSFASRDFWLLFSSSGGYWHSAAGHPQWVSWYNPEPLRVTRLFIKGHSAGNLKHFKVQASDDNLSWIDLKEVENTVQTDNYEVDLTNNNEYYLYYRLYITSSYYGSYDLINGFNMTAVSRGTPSDYDFYEDIYKAVKGTTEGITQWTQPPYSDWIGNNDATWDPSRLYTCTCDGSHNPSTQPGVASLEGSGAGWHTSTSSLPHWVGYYTEPIRVSKFGFYVGGTSDYVPTAFSWQGSHDGGSWTTLGTFTRDGNLTTTYEEYTIPENNRNFYEFNRLYITRGNRSFQYICGMKITADAFPSISSYKVVQKADPPGQEDIYMNGNAMVVRAGTQMEFWTQSTTEIYTLSEDIVISDLLSTDSGTLTNLDTYMYYPSFEKWNTVGISSIKSTEYTSGITIDGVSYTHSNRFDTSNYYCTYWWDAFTDGLFENTAYTGSNTWDVFGTGNWTNTYCTAKCTGSPNTTYRISSDGIVNPKDYSYSWPQKTIENITMIVHTNADPQDSTGYISKQTGRTLNTYSYSCSLNIEAIQFTTDSTGEFYVTFCVPNNNMVDPGFQLSGSIGFKSKINEVVSLFNTPLGIRLSAANWQGEGYPNEIYIDFQRLDYGSEQFKYLITVQSDGSAVITNNPNYQPT